MEETTEEFLADIAAHGPEGAKRLHILSNGSSWDIKSVPVTNDLRGLAGKDGINLIEGETFVAISQHSVAHGSYAYLLDLKP